MSVFASGTMVATPPDFLGRNSTTIAGVTTATTNLSAVAYVYDYCVLLLLVTFAGLKCYFNTFLVPLYALLSGIGCLASLVYNLSRMGVPVVVQVGIGVGYPSLLVWLSALCTLGLFVVLCA